MHPRRILIPLLFCSFAQSHAQSLDSLWGLWNDPTVADTVRLSALMKICQVGYLNSHPDSADLLARQAYELAERIGSKQYMAESLILQAVLLGKAFKNEEALALNERALKLAEEGGYRKEMGKVLNNIGIIYQNQGDYARSDLYFQRALSIRAGMKDTRGTIGTLSNIGINHRSRGDFPKAMQYGHRTLALAEAVGDDQATADALVNLAITSYLQGDHPAALDFNLRSLELKEKLGDLLGVATVRMNMAAVYYEHGDYATARKELRQCLAISEKVGNAQSMANSHINLGNVYQELEELDTALVHYSEARKIMADMNYPQGIAAIAVNMGVVYELKEDFDAAIAEYRTAFELCDRLGERFSSTAALNNIAIIQRKQGLLKDALRNATSALEQARAIQAPALIQNGAKSLYEIYSDLGRPAQALEMLKLHIHLRDSILSEGNRSEVMRLGLEHEFEKQAALDSLAFVAEQRIKDVEIAGQRSDLLKQRIALASTGGGLLLIVALAISIYKGKQRSDELLLNILPYETAQELKAKGSAEAKLFDEVTVLFTDFKGFTQIAEKLSPQELVGLINECFSAFDRIMGKYGIEKIKTIGDAYMAASGLPVANTTNAVDVVLAALEIQKFMSELHAVSTALGKPTFEIRIGVHTGPVVAGIVGIKKFQYDIWGDTVNTASRMESSGEVGRVNISGTTYDRVKDRFTCTPRGEVEAKGKGMIRMYFVDRRYEPDNT